MADIAMCFGKDCPMKLQCYRFTAVPNEYAQSYGEFKHKDGKCDAFLANATCVKDDCLKGKRDVKGNTENN